MWRDDAYLLGHRTFAENHIDLKSIIFLHAWAVWFAAHTDVGLLEAHHTKLKVAFSLKILKLKDL